MSENKWTTEQQMAIDTRDCNLLVAAAAGGGKTAVLVERIIKRITNEERPVDIDRLLVVTFTNAAASEMRERIGEAISESLDKNPESRRLQNQLTLLNRASITTIHSFCLEVIKNNFHKIDLDPGFRIGDGTETVLLKQETAEELFDEWYERENRRDFLSLVECYGRNRDDSKLQEMVLDLYDYVKSFPWPEKWVEEAIENFNIDEGFEFKNSRWARVILDSLRIELGGLQSSMERTVAIIKKTDGLEPYLATFEVELGQIKKLASSCDSWDDLRAGFNDIQFGKLKAVKNADTDAKEKVQKIRNKVKEEIKKLQTDVFSLGSDGVSRQINHLYPLMKTLGQLVMGLDEKYSIKKREKGIIDFNDIEHFALSILTEVDGEGKISPSNIALAYRDKFDEVLVDEYQDSNFVQEYLLDTISRKDIPNRFMVGDVKQSIYRFRQAKPELFLDKYSTYSTTEGERNRKITLYKNFRSRSEVIEGANYIFKRIMSKNIGELDYTDEERLNLGTDYKNLEDEESITGGPVELHIIETAALEGSEVTEEDEDGDFSEEGAEEEEPLNNIQLEARMVVKRIRELMGANEGRRFKVFDKNLKNFRPLQYRDIVILLRATSNWAPVFSEELTKAGIPVFADTGVGYFQTSEIKTVISLLEVIDNPMQDIPLIAVLRSPIFGFTPDELLGIRLEEPDKTIYEAIKKASESLGAIGEKSKFFIECLRKWQGKSLHLSTDEFLWYLYKETGFYSYAGAMPGGAQRQANLRILFERAKQYEDTSFKGLFNFINFINRLKASSGDMGSAKILGENEDVVRIMSIHKSKGLEFPVVFVSGMGKRFNMMDLNKDILFHHELGFGPQLVDYNRRISYPSIIKEAIKKKVKLESLSEEMRVLYVAFTRAKEKLIITGCASELEKSLGKWFDAGIGERVSEASILKASTSLDWICPAVINHRDCKVIREGLAEEIEYNDEVSRWAVKLWKRDEVLNEETEEVKAESNILEKLEALNLDQWESEYAAEIERRLGYRYPFEKSSGISAKISVTEVKRMINSYPEDEDSKPLYSSTALKKPSFVDESTGLSAAERGTIMHLVMQKLDFSRISSREEIRSQVENLIECQILTMEQAGVVNFGRIESFFRSEFGRRMLSSNFIRREVPFHMEISSTEIYRELPEEDYSNEYIAIQGIIDCFFEENGDIVLLDYKTDRVTPENVNEIKERYRVQLDLYARALERITGKRVKERFIYLFDNGVGIKY